MPRQLPNDLAESLAAAVADRTNIHNDSCTVYSEGPEFGCACGVPRLLADLAGLLGVEASDWRSVLYAAGGKGFASQA